MTSSAIAAVIAMLAPWLSAPSRAAYATAIHREAQAVHCDPLDLVAHIQHESGWHERAVSPDGEDLGLGQIRARFYGGCVEDADPVAHPSKACAATRTRLLTAAANIHALAAAVRAWRDTCLRRTWSAERRHVWAGLAGVRGSVCGQMLVKGRWRDGRVARPVREVLQLRAMIGRAAKRIQ